jgi:hypothetical protein
MRLKPRAALACARAATYAKDTWAAGVCEVPPPVVAWPSGGRASLLDQFFCQLHICKLTSIGHQWRMLVPECYAEDGLPTAAVPCPLPALVAAQLDMLSAAREALCDGACGFIASGWLLSHLPAGQQAKGTVCSRCWRALRWHYDGDFP